MVVAHVIPDQPAKMLLVQRNDMVQNLSTATAHKALGDAVLPRRPDTRSLGFQTRCLQQCDDVRIEGGVAVEDDVTVPGAFGKSLTQLLDHPLRRRMGSDVEVQDPPASVLDDEKAVQQFECHGWHGEEVEGSDYLSMVLEKAQPTLARVAPATNSPKIPGHTSF